VGDLLAMLIEVIGVKDERPIKIRYRVLEYYDHQNKVSAMARTTAYTGSIIAQLLVSGVIKEKGVILMEQIGQNHDIVNKLFSELAQRDVKIIEY
jgi:lysine 6-dehydrogenase